jgi:hypothetical protein
MHIVVTILSLFAALLRHLSVKISIQSSEYAAKRQSF